MRVLLAAALFSVPLTQAVFAQSQSNGASDRAAAEPPRLEFDVASIKRHAGDTPVPCSSPTGATVALTSRTLPSGQITITGTCARTLVARAYAPGPTPRIEGLPGWAESERYDADVKSPPGASAADRQRMWQALLADRMKLSVHLETRTIPSYDLILARPDRRLGPGLRPSPLDCAADAGPSPAAPPATPSSPAQFTQRCHVVMTTTDHLYAGGIRIDQLAGALARAADRPIVNRTALEGYYAVDMNFVAIANAPTGPDGIDAPSVFTAVQDQLGLKLQPATTEVQVVIVDHIERPTEN